MSLQKGVDIRTKEINHFIYQIDRHIHSWWRMKLMLLGLCVAGLATLLRKITAFQNVFWCKIIIISCNSFPNYTPAQQSCRGVYWFHSVCPSVRPSYILCPLCSAYSSWLDPFHIYTSYQATSEGVSHVKFLAKFQIFGNFLKSCNFDFVFFWLGIWCESLVWVIMGEGGGGGGAVAQNAGYSVPALKSYE